MLLKLLGLLPLLLGQAQHGPREHFKRDVEGWTVQVDPRLFVGENRPVGARALRLLATQLDVIKARMQPDRVRWLQSHVRIFLELENGDQRQPVYHPSADWLKEHGYSTELEKAVHIPVASFFIGEKDDLKMLNYRADDPENFVKQLDAASAQMNSPEMKKAFEDAKKKASQKG